jgi:hypothetical protein
MRTFLPAALSLALAGCQTPSQWEKPGASPQMAAADITDCRNGAAHVGFMFYPWGVPPDWFYRRSNWVYWSDIQDSQRVAAEKEVTAFCMRNKGYELVPSPRAAG